MSNKTLFTKYLKNLYEVAAQGDAREESFYPALADMLRDVAQSGGRTDVHVTTLPRQTDAGNPDFRIWNGSDRIIGYVEAKKPTEERLDVIENSEQLRRYRDTFPNLILTNFLEFRLYRNGQLVDTVLAARRLRLFFEKAVVILKTCRARDEQENLSCCPWFAGNGFSGRGAWPCVFYRSLVTDHWSLITGHWPLEEGGLR